MGEELYRVAEALGAHGHYELGVPGLPELISALDLAIPGSLRFIRAFQNVDGWRATAVPFFDDHSLFLATSLLAYPPVIYLLVQLMKNREPFDLRVPLICWNLFLAAFSFLGALYLVPAIIAGIDLFGWWTSVCTRWCYGNGDATFLIFLFDLSKVLEFIDTVFIVLRKKPLIFLHYYHHVATMAFCWYCNQTAQEYGCHGFYFATMNFFVHFVMYTYYAVMAMGIRIPSFISTSITTLQIVQMVIGVAIVYTLTTCKEVDTITIYFGSILYFSFFVLFAEFFYKRYFSAKPRRPASSDPQPNNGSKSPKQKSQ
jgi:elongation of very long chain fatty acids protein 6